MSGTSAIYDRTSGPPNGLLTSDRSHQPPTATRHDQAIPRSAIACAMGGSLNWVAAKL